MSILEQQKTARRERILVAARTLIEDHGYDGLTMRDLADASGVTVPTVYNLIGSKEQVLLAAVEDQTRPFVSGLEGAAGDLLDVVEAAVRQMVRRPRYYRALLRVLATSRQAAAARRHVDRALTDQIDRALRRLETRGGLEPWVDLDTLAERIHAQLDAAALEWARGTSTTSSFRAAAVFDAATTMLGLTNGVTRSRFEQAIRDSQTRARRRRPPSDRAGRAA